MLAVAHWLTNTLATSATFIADLGNSYAFYSIARDNVGHEEIPPPAPDAWTLALSNAPTLVAVTNAAASPGSSLAVSNFVQGAFLGQPRFSLEPGAPSGATINPTNGLLRWTPTCSQASRTFPITVWVTDSGRSNIMDAISFTVSVSECVVPSLGRLVLREGDNGRVPVNLSSTVPLTNLAMTVETAAGRLTNLWIEPIVAEVCASSLTPSLSHPMGEGDFFELSLTTCTNQFLMGTQQVAWLHFTAVSNRPSAVVDLRLDNTEGRQADGTPVRNFAPQSGRLVIIGQEPRLEMVRDTNRQPRLFLFGKPASGYSVEARLELTTGAWQSALPGLAITTNLWLDFPPPGNTNRRSYYRALRQ